MLLSMYLGQICIVYSRVSLHLASNQVLHWTIRQLSLFLSIVQLFLLSVSVQMVKRLTRRVNHLRQYRRLLRFVRTIWVCRLHPTQEHHQQQSEYVMRLPCSLWKQWMRWCLRLGFLRGHNLWLEYHHCRFFTNQTLDWFMWRLRWRELEGSVQMVYQLLWTARLGWIGTIQLHS